MRKLYSILAATIIGLFSFSTAQAQYCAVSGGYSTTWTGISIVSTTGAASNFYSSTAMSTGYFNYTGSQSATATAGSSFTLRITARRGHRAFIDWNGDGTFATNEQVAAYPSTSSITATRTYTVTVPSNASIGANRIRVVQGYYSSGSLVPTPCGYYGYRGEVEDYGLNIQPPPPNDAGATYAASTICPGTNDFQVRVSNYGSNALTSVTVNASFGATTYGPTTFTGLNVPTGGDTVLTMGQYTASSGNNYLITCSTSSPNGQTDGNTSNDAYSGTLTPALRGTFTLGGSTPDYNTFSSFMSDLASNGVCDTVILNVRQGTYNERINLNNVNGADLTNAPIIIQSDPANTTKPLINYSSTYMVYVNGGHDFIMKGLQFGTTSSGSGARVYFAGSADNIVFDGNDFVQRNINSTSTFYSCVYASGSANRTNIKFHNNSFDYGTYQVYARGSNSSTSGRLSGWELVNNSFTNSYDYAMYSYYNNWDNFSDNYFGPTRENGFNYNCYVGYSDYTTFENNEFDQSTAPSSQRGYNAYFNYCYYGDFINNEAVSYCTGSYKYNMYFNYCRYSNFEDNYSELSGTAYGYGMYFYYPEQSTIERNEVNISNSGGTTYGMYMAYPRGTSANPTIIANNMVYQGALNANSIYLWYIWGSGVNDVEFLHNSTHMQLGSSNARAAYFTMSGSNINIRNNVFTNNGPGYSAFFTNSGYNTDNNCYYSNGGSTGIIGGSTFTDLSSLQAISSTNDQNSLVYMPTYISNTDLHMFYDKTIDQAGSAAATIVPEDWDGDQRDAVTPDIGLDEYLVPRNSVALVSIDNPVTPICALGGLYDVSILNVGTGTLSSFNVDGEVRHVGGGVTPLTTFSYNGSVATNGTASLNAGNYTTGFVNGDTLLLWVSNPNGVNDSIQNDDTLMVALTEGIRGTFTVGDTSGGNPSGYDYGSLAAVEHLLDSVGAICDTVVFELADGSYTGDITLHELIGTAPDRPVIFRSENADPSLVTISTGANSTIFLDGADNVHFLDLRILNTNSGSATLLMDNNNDNVTIDNCIVQNATTGSTAAFSSAIRGEATGEQNNVTIVNSHITGGAYGISIGGNGSNTNENLVIENNLVENAYYRGIQTNYADGFMINNNEVTSNSSYTNGEAIYAQNSSGVMEVMYNEVLNYGVWPRYGVRLDNSSSLSSNYAKIANNLIHVGTFSSGNQFYGMYLNNTSFMDINHNTSVVEGSSSTSAALYISNGGANEVRNNILANMGAGRAMEVYSTYALTYSDYNNFFTNGTQVTRFDSQNSADLAAWQSNTGLDANSVGVDPMFYSMQDLKVCAPDLDGAGITSYVMYDIQDQMRDANNPDIGADEFTAPSKFSLPADTVICKGDEITFNALLNDGSFAIWDNFLPSATYTVNGAGIYKVFVSNVCGQAIDSIEVTENAPATLPNDTHICANTALMLDPQVPNATYDWSTGASTPNISVTSRGIYAVEVTDGYGCITSDTIEVTQSRAVSLPADTAFCAGNTYAVNASVGQGSYFWAPTNQFGPIIYIQSTGNYVVSYVDQYGCSSTDAMMVDVVEEPQAQFSYNNQYYTVAFSDMSADADSYLWVFGDGDSSTIANPTHIYPGPNRYRVQLYVMNDCGMDVYEDVINIGALPGFAENLAAGEFNVFPNPNTGNFKITMNATADDYSIEVLNLEGKIVFQNTLENVVPGINEVEVSLDDVSTGVYFVRVTGENGTKVQKINVQ